jgi:hypothetical protein
VAGDAPEVGVYFVPADGGAAVKVAGHLAENTASKLIGVIPALGAGKWKMEVKTQYTGASSTSLKKSRVIEGSMTLTVPSVAA